ncbi:hypothetical protein ACEQPO_25515 [Bacillus sp. SL00103]
MKALDFFIVNHTLHCMLNEWKSQNALSLREKLDHMREMVTHEAFSGCRQTSGTIEADRSKANDFIPCEVPAGLSTICRRY